MNLIPSGLTDYSAVNDYQHALHAQVARGEAEDTLIVGEFAPAWTAGRGFRDMAWSRASRYLPDRAPSSARRSIRMDPQR